MPYSFGLALSILSAGLSGPPANETLDSTGTLFSRFHDDFERPRDFLGDTPGTFSGDQRLDGKWQILRGTVDVVKRSDRYGFLVRDPSVIPTPDPQGRVLDLEGSEPSKSTPAKIRTVHGFEAGTYRLRYKLSGTNRVWEGIPEASFPYTVKVREGTRLVFDAICPWFSRGMAGLILDDVDVVRIR